MNTLANQCIADCIYDVWLHSDTLIVKTECKHCRSTYATTAEIYEKFSIGLFFHVVENRNGFKRAISEFSIRGVQIMNADFEGQLPDFWPNRPVRISRKTEIWQTYYINTYIEYFTYTNRSIEEFILPNGCYKSVHACNCTYIHKLGCRHCEHQIIRKRKRINPRKSEEGKKTSKFWWRKMMTHMGTKKKR